MENEPKKISFGFNKSAKKSNILVKSDVPKEKSDTVQLIEYLEGQSIKVVGNDENKPKGPLVIPMKEANKKLINLIDIVKNDFKTVVDENNDSKKTDVETKAENDASDNKLGEKLSLEELAAKELLNDSKNVDAAADENKRVITTTAPDKLLLEGEKESSIEDYENIPIDEFGKAMLRGMGWKDGEGIGKNQKLVKMSQPVIRPKGMGLGADKMAKQDSSTAPAVDRDGNALKCVRGAYVKVIVGYHKGVYGQIIGLDDESGRFIIKTALNNLNISLNEFLVTPVTKEEYGKKSKVLNNAKYEEYLKKKDQEKEAKLKLKSKSSSDDDNRSKSRERNSNFPENVRVKQEPSADLPNQSDYKQIKQQIKKENLSDSEERHKNFKQEKETSDYENDRMQKHRIKKERKSDYSESEEENPRRNADKNYKRSEEKYRENEKKYGRSSKYSEEKYTREEKGNTSKHDKGYRSKKHSTDESDYENSRRKYDSDENYTREGKRDKNRRSKKYSSEESDEEKEQRHRSRKRYEENYTKGERRDRSRRDRSRERNRSKRYADKLYSENEEENYHSRKKEKNQNYQKKSNKCDNANDSDDYSRKSKKKHKKKKSSKYNSENSSDEKQKYKSKKNGSRNYDNSDSDSEEYYKKKYRTRDKESGERRKDKGKYDRDRR